MLTGIPGGNAACAAPSQGTEGLIRIADFNRDGRENFLIIVSQNGATDLSLWMDGMRLIGRVPGPVSNATGGREAWVEAADMDQDGDLDIAGVAQSAVGASSPAVKTVFWMENRGSSSWLPHVIDEGSLGINVTGGTFRAADLDGDGKPELFAPGPSGTLYTRSCRN